MREVIRPVVTALSIGCLAMPLATLPGSAWAQARQTAPAPAAQPPQAPKEVALTDKQIEGVLASQKDFDAITSKLPEDAGDKPDPKVTAQLDAVARKNGFASYDEYNDVVDTIGMVLAGFDPQTKKYVGPEAVLKSQIAAVQADKKMSAKDKKQALDEMNAALKTPAPPVQNKANIDLVTRYYDKLAEVLGGADE